MSSASTGADGDVAATAAAAFALRADTGYGPLLEAIGDSQFVLLGESTHGTDEYYAHRAAITKQLVETKGFSVVLIEGDWPSAYRVSRYMGSEGSTDRAAHEALASFEGFPSWMRRAVARCRAAQRAAARSQCERHGRPRAARGSAGCSRPAARAAAPTGHRSVLPKGDRGLAITNISGMLIANF